MYDPGMDVVVVNYRTPELLKDFIDSYRFQGSKVDTELIVVDVDPTEAVQEQVSEILSHHRDLQIQYWPIDWNCGYSGACNWASQVSNREVIAFFNSDTRLFDDTLDLCYDYLLEHDDVAICGPMQVDSRGRVTHAGMFGSNTKTAPRGWLSRNPNHYREDRDDAITVSGSAYFVKRGVWDEMARHPAFLDCYPNAEGAMLPTPHYYEETWCSYFARHLGHKVAYVGSAVMVHEWHKSSPVGSVEGSVMATSRQMFRDMCDYVGIAHD